jgi:regulator of sigma E protease
LLAFVVLSGFFAIKNEASWVEGKGLMIQEVEVDSAAAKAGIQPGDILLEADGKTINKPEDLEDVINSKGNDSNTLLVERNGETSEVAVEPSYDTEYHRKLIGVFLCWGLVTQVDETSPADPPIKPGDTILAINGAAVYSDESLANALSSAKEGDKIEVMLIQGEERVDSSFILASQDPVQAIGVQNQWVQDTHIETKHYSVWQSPIRAGGYMFVDLPRDMRTAMTTVVKDDPSKAFVGPVGAGQLAVETVKSFGFGHFLFLAGLISIGLALFNFIPIPPLDGGGMLVALIEGIRRGKRLSTKATQLVYTVGTAIMLSLFVLIMYSDIVRLIHGENFIK